MNFIRIMNVIADTVIFIILMGYGLLIWAIS